MADPDSFKTNRLFLRITYSSGPSVTISRAAKTTKYVRDQPGANMPSSPQHPIPGSATAEYLELNKLPRREHQRRTSPHPETTGNGGPRNGDYVLLGGAECGPPPPPTTRSRDLIPRTLPHRGRDKATEAARPSQLARARSRPGESECGGTHTKRTAAWSTALGARPPAPPPSYTRGLAPNTTTRPTGRSLATSRSL